MKSDILKAAYSPEIFREKGHQLIDLMADHLKTTLDGNSEKVIQWTLPDQELKYWQDYKDKKTSSDLFQDLLHRIIHIHNPNYMGHQISPSLPLSGLTGLTSALLNNGMGIYEMGAAPTAMERVVTDYLCQKVGYSKNARGILTSGGTLANLTAMLSARQDYLHDKPNSYEKEYQLAVMVSEEAHYCIDRAVKIMGLGDQGIIKIPTQSNFKIRTDLLEEYYINAHKNNIRVFAIVGSAPSTATGIYDDIQQLVNFATQKGIWLHIDGAHGGAAIFSSKYKSLLEGIESADSIVIDGHKMMMMPGITTALLYREGQDSHNTFIQKADYLLEESEEEDWYNLAKRTFECTKHMMSLHWYAILMEYGPEIFDAFLTKLYDLATEFAMILKEDPDFELAIEPMSNILCFRYTGPSARGHSLDDFNKAIRKKILDTGTFYIVQTKLGATRFLRTTIMNPFSTPAHFSRLLDHIKEVARSVAAVN